MTVGTGRTDAAVRKRRLQATSAPCREARAAGGAATPQRPLARGLPQLDAARRAPAAAVCEAAGPHPAAHPPAAAAAAACPRALHRCRHPQPARPPRPRRALMQGMQSRGKQHVEQYASSTFWYMSPQFRVPTGAMRRIEQMARSPVLWCIQNSSDRAPTRYLGPTSGCRRRLRRQRREGPVQQLPRLRLKQQRGGAAGTTTLPAVRVLVLWVCVWMEARQQRPAGGGVQEEHAAVGQGGGAGRAVAAAGGQAWAGRGRGWRERIRVGIPLLQKRLHRDTWPRGGRQPGAGFRLHSLAQAPCETADWLVTSPYTQ